MWLSTTLIFFIYLPTYLDKPLWRIGRILFFNGRIALSSSLRNVLLLFFEVVIDFNLTCRYIFLTIFNFSKEKTNLSSYLYRSAMCHLFHILDFATFVFTEVFIDYSYLFLLIHRWRFALSN